MNKKINQTKLEIAQIEGEFSLKLKQFLKNEFYVDMDYYNVNIKCDRRLSDDEIKNIEDEFLLELDGCEVIFDGDGHFVSVWYNFNHKRIA
jgi:hypothetical protein